MKNYGEEILQMVDICKVFDLGDGKKLHAAENVNVTIHKGRPSVSSGNPAPASPPLPRC